MMNDPGLLMADRLEHLFTADALSCVMAALIAFVVLNVNAFSRRYTAGDRRALAHRCELLLLGVGALGMVAADHLAVLLAGWAVSYGLLIRLMIHQPGWKAARESGKLAGKKFALAFGLLAAAFACMVQDTGTAHIHAMLRHAEAVRPAGLILLALAAFIISAAWPFQRWLLSSLNSPTPVSALMHAGLVNGGGYLLVRFAPLYLAHGALLHGIFVVGLASAVVGTFWKLMQTDIKRMLAGSTMAQMGFMLMQCGMGLFACAVSHLCWHGLFKAYLFLNSPSTVDVKRRTDLYAPLPWLALPCGLAGAAAFVGMTAYRTHDTWLIMIGVAFLAAAQVAATTLQSHSLPVAVAASAISGTLYGASLHLVDKVLEPLALFRPQPLDAVYVGGFMLLAATWLLITSGGMDRLQSHAWWKALYVDALNASQPHPATVSATRS